MINPYAGFLGDRNPLQVIAETPERLAQLVKDIGAGIDRPPKPGKWSAREILCHLADCEIVFAFRLRQALAEENYVIQPFDQEKWAVRYDGLDAPLALQVFTSVRQWNSTFLKNVPQQAQSKMLTHPERGSMPFHVLAETMAGHDLNHLEQLERIAA